jgi:hypothetical protein
MLWNMALGNRAQKRLESRGGDPGTPYRRTSKLLWAVASFFPAPGWRDNQRLRQEESIRAIIMNTRNITIEKPGEISVPVPSGTIRPARGVVQCGRARPIAGGEGTTKHP